MTDLERLLDELLDDLTAEELTKFYDRHHLAKCRIPMTDEEFERAIAELLDD